MKRLLLVAFFIPIIFMTSLTPIQSENRYTFPEFGLTNVSLSSRKVYLNNIDQEMYWRARSSVSDAPRESQSLGIDASVENVASSSQSPHLLLDSELDIKAKIHMVFGLNSNIAEQIVFKESSFNPLAIHVNSNGSVDRGLFQINSVHKNRVKNLYDLFDVDVNIRIAKAIFNESHQSFRAWSSCNFIKGCS